MRNKKRRVGKTFNNFFTLFDLAMFSFSSYTNGGFRIETFAEFIISGFSF